MSKLIYQLITINTKPQSIELYSEPNVSTPVARGLDPRPLAHDRHKSFDLSQ